MTGNQTYLDWANKVFNWSSEIGLVDNLYNVFDGTDDTVNCTGVDHHQWTYNLAMYLYGAAVMQNYTNASVIWVQRTAGLLDATATFFSPYPNATNIMFEAECETSETCNVDQYSMKAYLARFLASTSVLAPFTAGKIASLLRASAIGAASACVAGPFGNTCGAKWYINGSDGTSGLGQQLSAMEVMYSLLVNATSPPMVLGNVRIRDEPPTVTSILVQMTQPAQPSNSARPLYDSGNEATKAGKGSVLYLSGAFLLALLPVIS